MVEVLDGRPDALGVFDHDPHGRGLGGGAERGEARLDTLRHTPGQAQAEMCLEIGEACEMESLRRAGDGGDTDAELRGKRLGRRQGAVVGVFQQAIDDPPLARTQLFVVLGHCALDAAGRGRDGGGHYRYCKLFCRRLSSLQTEFTLHASQPGPAQTQVTQGGIVVSRHSVRVMNRRQFVMGSGAVVGAAALAACTSTTRQRRRRPSSRRALRPRRPRLPQRPRRRRQPRPPARD